MRQGEGNMRLNDKVAVITGAALESAQNGTGIRL